MAIDLDTIDDMDRLKSLAYDQIAAKERATTNLNMINQRIQTLLDQTGEDTAISQNQLPGIEPKDEKVEED